MVNDVHNRYMYVILSKYFGSLLIRYPKIVLRTLIFLFFCCLCFWRKGDDIFRYINIFPSGAYFDTK